MRALHRLVVFLFFVFIFSGSFFPETAFTKESASTEISIPLIKNIDPNPVVASNSPQTLKITGSGFSVKSQVTLKTENKTYVILPERTKFLNPDLLEIIVNVLTQPSSWTVEVKTPDGNFSQPFQFKVISSSLLKSSEESKEKAGELINKEAKKIEIEQLEKKAEEIKEVIKEKKTKIKTVQEEAAKAQKKATESEVAFKKMQEELSRISKERAAKRTVLDKSLSAALIVFVGWVILFLKRYGVKKFEQYITPEDAIRESENVLRLKTISELFHWIGTVIIFGIVVFLVLDEFGINMAPLLAGAGIIGLAFGFGGQYLIRDVINGIFILIEGQFHIDDVVKIGDIGGVVEAFNLRHTRLRDLEGRVIYIPNGKIEQVINFTRDYSYILLDIGVAYKENVDRVIEVMKDVGREMREDLDFGKLIIEDLDMLGVNSFDDSQVTIRCRIKTFPMKQWGVGREFRRRIKNRFDELGIEIPFPHRTLYWGAASENDWMKDLVNPKI